MNQLKLIAFDTEDLDVVSAHLQDAVVRTGDMAYLQREKRFAAILGRFDWSGSLDERVRRRRHERRQSALRIEHVLKAQYTGIDLGRAETILSLLAIRFEPTASDDPSGFISLYFSGSATIRLEVECIETELVDLGPSWRTRNMPRHPDDDSSP